MRRVTAAPKARWLALSLSVWLAGGVSAVLTAAEKPSLAPVPPKVALLPRDLQQQGSEILAAKEEGRRAKLASALAEEQPSRADAFLIALLDWDQSSLVRLKVVDEFGAHPRLSARQALERRAVVDPDPRVCLHAIESLRQQSARLTKKLLEKRLESARRRGDSDETRQLEAEEERWISIARGAMLPSFLRQPTAFALLPGRAQVRVLAFGDFGDGSPNQKQTAEAMLRVHEQKPFDFGLALGDNFYKEGSESPSDPRWKTWWEDLYGPLGIRFYAVLGNHDWKLPDSPAAEILYSQKSSSWDMPAPYYTFTAGPVQFFALDTTEVSQAQLDWLRTEINGSTSRWKVVFGHHPIYSAGHHGDTVSLLQRLLPVLRDRADIYLCGHDHDLQELRADGGVHFFVAGGGGAETRPLHADPRSVFGKDAHGFAVIDANESELTVHLIGSDGLELHRDTLRKP